MIKFCKVCESMLHPLEDDDKLYLKCNDCGYKEENKDLVIFSKSYSDTGQQTENISNRYIVYDNTIPRTSKKLCPNDLCPSRTDKSKQEAVFYPTKVTMEIIYVCTACNTEWKYT